MSARRNDRVDLFKIVRSKLNIERSEIMFELFQSSRSDNRAGNTRLMDGPGECELRESYTFLLS
jgi:hypothetical protein